jgi:hypothetical protein
MAIRTVNVNFDTPERDIFAVCDNARLKGKESNEVYQSLDALRVWRNRFESRQGKLLQCDHHSNPDDPPDLTLHFDGGVLPVEHTRLEPYPYGKMRAIHDKEFPDRCISVPAISNPPADRESLVHEMMSFEREWPSVEDELNEWRRICISVIQRKIGRRGEGTLVIQDTSLLFRDSVRQIAKAIHSAFSTRSALIKGWTIIFHSRWNRQTFYSALVAEREDLLETGAK